MAASVTAPPLAPRAWLRYDVVSRLVRKLNPATVLEIGAGQGAVGARLAAHYDYLGVEPDSTSFQIAEPRITAAGGSLIQGMHSAIPAGSTFDLVCAFEVLEHIDADRAALAEWVDYVAPGGHLMLSVPAFQDRFAPMDVEAGHFRRYEPDQLAQLIGAAGLVDVDITVYGWPLGYALEVVRNRVSAKRLAKVPEKSAAEWTAASGRILQPSRSVVGEVSRLGTFGFRYLQRVRPTAGTGLIALARKP
jgi:SAM-dependent methyltransferase